MERRGRRGAHLKEANEAPDVMFQLPVDETGTVLLEKTATTCTWASGIEPRPEASRPNPRSTQPARPGRTQGDRQRTSPNPVIRCQTARYRFIDPLGQLSMNRGRASEKLPIHRGPAGYARCSPNQPAASVAAISNRDMSL
jgi:hypothetical protein